jgi:transcriptional regulator with XRE-family HTH domain
MRNNIKKIREELGITGRELAEKLGISPSTLHSWERENTEPTPSQQQDVAMALGVSMSDAFPHVRINVGRNGIKLAAETYASLRETSRVRMGDRMLVRLANVADFGQTFVPGKVVQLTPYWFRVELDKTGASVCYTYQEFMTDSSIRRIR